MGKGQCRGDVGGDVGGPVRMDAPLGSQHLGEAPALDVLHDDEVGALFLAPVVDAHDVRVVQVRRRLSLSPEALHEVGVTGEFVEQDLHGDRAVKQQVPRQVDVGHAAARYLAMQFVTVVEDCGSRRWHGAGFYRQPDSPGRRSGLIGGSGFQPRPEALDQAPGLVERPDDDRLVHGDADRPVQAGQP